MEKDRNMNHGEDSQKSDRKVHFSDNSKSSDDKRTPHPDGQLPEDDPALINPDELATFPEEQKNLNPDIESESESHLVNRKSSPVREGRNITRTDTTPDNDGGFM